MMEQKPSEKNKSNRMYLLTILGEDILLDVFDFITRKELGQGVSLASKYLNEKAQYGMFTRGEHFVRELWICPDSSGPEMKDYDGDKIGIGRFIMYEDKEVNIAEAGAVINIVHKNLEIPTVPPPKNILGLTKINFFHFYNWTDIDQAIIDFFIAISSKLPQMTIQMDLKIVRLDVSLSGFGDILFMPSTAILFNVLCKCSEVEMELDIWNYAIPEIVPDLEFIKNIGQLCVTLKMVAPEEMWAQSGMSYSMMGGAWQGQNAIEETEPTYWPYELDFLVNCIHQQSPKIKETGGKKLIIKANPYGYWSATAGNKGDIDYFLELFTKKFLNGTEQCVFTIKLIIKISIPTQFALFRQAFHQDEPLKNANTKEVFLVKEISTEEEEAQGYLIFLIMRRAERIAEENEEIEFFISPSPTILPNLELEEVKSGDKEKEKLYWAQQKQYITFSEDNTRFA